MKKLLSFLALLLVSTAATAVKQDPFKIINEWNSSNIHFQSATREEVENLLSAMIADCKWDTIKQSTHSHVAMIGKCEEGVYIEIKGELEREIDPIMGYATEDAPIYKNVNTASQAEFLISNARYENIKGIAKALVPHLCDVLLVNEKTVDVTCGKKYFLFTKEGIILLNE